MLCFVKVAISVRVQIRDRVIYKSNRSNKIYQRSNQRAVQSKYEAITIVYEAMENKKGTLKDR